MDAEISFNKAIELNKYSADAFQGKGNIAQINKNIDKTIEYFSFAINLKPEKSELIKPSLIVAFNKRGYLHYKQKNYNSAIYDFEQSIKLFPDITLFETLSNLYIELSDHKKAKLTIESAIKLEPNNIKFLVKHASICLHLKLYDEAITDYTKALFINKANIEIYELRSHIYYLKTNYDAALKDCMQILTIDPLNSDAFYHISLIYCEKIALINQENSILKQKRAI